MAMQAPRTESRLGVAPEVFDRAHLARYTMNSADLEREIIGLFLMQLPATIAMIEEAKSAAEWRLATHTLKGSAMAVGARRLIRIAAQLEQFVFGDEVNVRMQLTGALHGATAEFQDAMRQLYG